MIAHSGYHRLNKAARLTASSIRNDTLLLSLSQNMLDPSIGNEPDERNKNEQ